MEQTLSQKKMILHYLQDGNYIDLPTSLELFSCARLAARIGDLRKEGVDIITEKVPFVNKFGNHGTRARYKLAENKDEKSVQNGSES